MCLYKLCSIKKGRQGKNNKRGVMKWKETEERKRK
jgi:hypothetical protein